MQKNKNNKSKINNKEKIVTASGKAYIKAGFNNTIVTIADNLGNALFSSSAGKVGFKGSRKSTPYAATKATESISLEANKLGMKEVSVIVKGPGMGRIAAIKALKSGGLNVVSIYDNTSIPFGGCRPKKKRRV